MTSWIWRRAWRAWSRGPHHPPCSGTHPPLDPGSATSGGGTSSLVHKHSFFGGNSCPRLWSLALTSFSMLTLLLTVAHGRPSRSRSPRVRVRRKLSRPLSSLLGHRVTVFVWFGQGLILCLSSGCHDLSSVSGIDVRCQWSQTLTSFGPSHVTLLGSESSATQCIMPHHATLYIGFSALEV